MTETTLFMRIQNIKNGAQYTDGSLRYSLFSPPRRLLRLRFPTECICRNSINVTSTDGLLAFYLNGNSTLAPTAAEADSPPPSVSAACLIPAGQRIYLVLDGSS